MTTHLPRSAAARLTLGLIAVSLLTTALLSPPPVQATTVAVAVEDFDFSPATRTIAVGDVVRWTFSGNPHSVTSRDGLFDSGVKDAGGSFQFTFTNAGTFRYYCVVHPDLMSGTIVVKDASATPRPTTATPRTTPKPTATARPTATSRPTATARPTATVKPTATATVTATSPSPSPEPTQSVAPTGSPTASEAIIEPPSPSTSPGPAPVPVEPANASDTTPIVAGAVLLVVIVAAGGLLLARRRRAV